MNKSFFLYLVTAIVILSVITGISILFYSRSTQKTNLPVVTTSFYPLYFFAKEVAGNYAEVVSITPSGTEPHDYEPTAQDVAMIDKSRMLIINGGVEPWADKILPTLKDKNTRIIIAAESLQTKQITEDGQTIQDPHIWLDPIYAKQEVTKIADGFKEIDPQNINTYSANEQMLLKRLDALDADYKKGLTACQKHDIITSHAAFAYLADRYNLRQVAVAGLSPNAEPSAQQISDVASFAKKNNIKYIFFESLVSPKLSETIAKEVGAQTLVLNPLEGISEEEQKTGKDYFSVMEDNLHNLQIALDCKQ